MAVEIVLGIDPGSGGAIAFLDVEGKLLDVVDMPNMPESNGRIATNAPLLAEILAQSHASKIFCEFVGARPTDAKVAAFAFGRARGVIEGCAGALNIPVVWVATNTWKRAANVPPGKENKDVALTRAIALWPQHAALFAPLVSAAGRKMSPRIDRAEAALIGLVGLQRGVLTPAPKPRKSTKRTKADLLAELEERDLLDERNS